MIFEGKKALINQCFVVTQTTFSITVDEYQTIESTKSI